MFWIVLGAVLVAVLLSLLFAVRRKAASREPAAYPYKKFGPLFTTAERSFLGVLDQAVGRDFRVFGKVRVADVLLPRNGLDKAERQHAFNRISRKHFDFVLCAPNDLTVQCAIELNDKSHQQKHRRERDEFLLRACRAAGVPLVSFDAQRAYVAADISARIAAAMTGPGQGNSANTMQAIEEAVAAFLPQEAQTVPCHDPVPCCPYCAKPMRKLVEAAGDKAGRESWECEDFPTCRETRETTVG
jgi:hypothetical protein